MKIIFTFFIAAILLSGCSKTVALYDSQIQATRDQTEVLKKQNEILQEINNKMK